MSPRIARPTKAVNNTRITSSSGSGSGASLDFNAKSSIQLEYKPKFGELKARLEGILVLPVLTLTPDCEHNFAAISKQVQAVGDRGPPRERQKRFGSFTMAYFNGLAHQLVCTGFGKDEMLQEGDPGRGREKRDQLRVVKKLVKKTYIGILVKNGLLIIQTAPKYWTTNTNDVREGIADIL